MGSKIQENMNLLTDIANSYHFEDKVIEKLDLQKHLTQFDPEIQEMLQEAYGPDLEALPEDEALCARGRMEDLFRALLSLKNVRDQKLILMRFGIVTGTGCTIEELTKIFNMSRDRVRHIESGFLRRNGRPKCIRYRRLIDIFEKD